MTTPQQNQGKKQPGRQTTRAHKRWGTTPAETADLIARAVDLRRRHMIYSDIATTLGISAPYAYQLVQKGIAAIPPTENAEALRKIESERLDTIRAALYPHAIQGDPASIDRWVKVSERWAKLLGIDAPARIEVEMVTREQIADELAAYLAGVDTSTTDRLAD